MGGSLSHVLRADGYASPSAASSGGCERAGGGGGSPQCAQGGPVFSFVDEEEDAREEGVRVIRARMDVSSAVSSRRSTESARPESVKLPDDVVDGATSPRRTVPPLRLGALAGALGAALPPDIGPATAVICTPPQDRILAELGLPADPAWPPSRADDYLPGDD